VEINQLLVSAVPGDAVTQAAMELRRVLRQAATSEIYARYVHESLARDVYELPDYRLRWARCPEEDVIIYHASIGEPDIHTFLLDRPEKLVVYYHNISPASPFYPYDPAFAGLLDAGRRELAELPARTILAMAVSEFNAAELRAMGFSDVRVAPLVMDLGRLHVDPAASVTELPPQMPLVLFVGQLLPHKRPDFLVQVAHVLDTYHQPVTLVLVGRHRLPRYSAALRWLVTELNLPNVLFTGGVSDAELAGWYQRADVFITASEHEGFCVPPLEAMTFDLPVVARACAAVPETVGDAGLLLAPGAGPLEMAEAVVQLLEQPDLAAGLTRRGRRRVEELSPERARAEFMRNILAAVAK
jgi:glycosyltransferase involved in cell wall biosynthesis